MRLYFIMLLAFSASTFFFGYHRRILAGVQIVVLIFLLIYSRIASRRRTAKLLDYLESISDSMDLTLRETPLPAAIYNSESGVIMWTNEKFAAITDMREPLFELNISDVVDGFSWDWLLSGKNECQEPVPVGDRLFKVYGNLVRSQRDYLAMTYWIDVTELERISGEYLDSRLVFTILAIDNYDELLKGISEKEKSVLLSGIDENIGAWAGDRGGYLCRYDRDRYFFLFEERYLDDFIQDKFSVLDTVREHIGADGVHATLCIGIGKDGQSPQENYRFASLGVEMALSRGGDQAVIRNRYGFEFFGGHSPQPEKRTKVKSRIMASAFGELVADASKVFIMGHRVSDFDSIGAAAGICCIARAKHKTARIITNLESDPSQALIDELKHSQEYYDVFITEQDAILEADSRTLLVVVDTSKPEMVVSQSLLLSCTRVAVVDHHRRAAEYIEIAVLNFIEPYASSTSELVTEMMQYLVVKDDIVPVEAEALLAGIVLDTKSFAINTGSRTFDAAAFLKRMGADASVVKRLLQTDIGVATEKYSLIRGAEIYRDGVILASGGDMASRVAIAQAADELLNIQGVNASFVTAWDGEGVFVSGRSFRGVNVQVILEKLGGGGSQSTAGLQVRGADVAKVAADVKKAIDEYFAK